MLRRMVDEDVYDGLGDEVLDRLIGARHDGEVRGEEGAVEGCFGF